MQRGRAGAELVSWTDMCFQKIPAYHTSFAGYRTREHGLTCPRRSSKEDTFWQLASKRCKISRISKELYNFLEFLYLSELERFIRRV
jgi:hypothetical protein